MDMQESSILNQFALRYQGQDYTFDKPLITIGSDSSCDIRIQNNPQILPMHANLMYRDGRILLRFIGRGAAIWVNGLPVAQQELKDQDEIALGTQETRMTLLLNNVSTLTTSPGIPVNGTPEARTSGLLHRDETGALSRSQPLSLPIKTPIKTPQAQPVTPLEPVSQRGLYAAMPQQTSLPTMSSKAQDSTRYLSTLGYLNEEFQDYVMKNVIFEERKALGESYGVDMSTVISWCKAGITRIDIRDGILTTLMGLLIIVYFFVVISLFAHESLASVFSAYSSPYSSPYSPGPPSILPLLSFLLSVFALIPVVVALIIGYNVEKWAKRRWPGSHPGIVTYFVILFACVSLMAATGVLGFVIYVLIWLTIFVELLIRYYGGAINRLRKNEFNPQGRPAMLAPNLERKLQESFVSGQRNVVAYSGEKPFAGAGDYEGGWSFLIDTSKGAVNLFTNERQTPLPFEVSSLYEAVKRDMHGIGLKDVLEVEGKLYVRGQYLPEHPEFFRTDVLRPTTSVDPSLVEFYKEHPTEDVRYYQCLRFNFWRGEMIFSVFLRFVKQGKDLFCEVNNIILLPMHPDCYWVDEREITPPLGEIWKLYTRSLDTPIQTWLNAPRRLLRSFTYTRQQRKLAQVVLNKPAFDYGAETSLRQVASDIKHHLFFQEIDQSMYLKVAQKQILETVSNFLEQHHINTEEFRQRQQMLLNSGIINTGTISNSNLIGSVSDAQVAMSVTSAIQPAAPGLQA